jgi:hypothetical protein
VSMPGLADAPTQGRGRRHVVLAKSVLLMDCLLWSTMQLDVCPSHRTRLDVIVRRVPRLVTEIGASARSQKNLSIGDAKRDLCSDRGELLRSNS